MHWCGKWLADWSASASRRSASFWSVRLDAHPPAPPSFVHPPAPPFCGPSALAVHPSLSWIESISLRHLLAPRTYFPPAGRAAGVR